MGVRDGEIYLMSPSQPMILMDFDIIRHFQSADE